MKREIIDSINNYCRIYKEGKFIGKNIQLSENPKISKIIPIYNDGKYLYYSLRSIQIQKMKDIEIIFTDDCSTDNSTLIIENYMKEDPRIRLFYFWFISFI